MPENYLKQIVEIAVDTTVPDDYLKQIIQTSIDNLFGNRLNPDSQKYAVQVFKEVYLSANCLLFEQWQTKVSDFAQNLQSQLNQAQTISERSTLRFACLWLQQGASNAVTQFFNKPREELVYLEQGIEQAEHFLAQGETTSLVRELVLRLYLNAGIMREQAPFNDTALAFKLYQRGLSHADNFLAQGETAVEVHEQVLQLHANANVMQEQAFFFNDFTSAFKFQYPR